MTLNIALCIFTVDSVVVWDTSSLNPAPSQVDIYLVSPEIEANLGRVTVWGNVPYSLGQFDVQLNSTLWNSTATIDMQVQIVQAGTPVFLNQMAAGPIFEVINASPSTGSASIAASNAALNSVTGGSKSRSSATSSVLMQPICGRRINLDHCGLHQLAVRYLVRLCRKFRQARSQWWKVRRGHRGAHPSRILCHRGV